MEQDPAPSTESTDLESSELQSSPEVEGYFHHYRGNDIPWYVRLMWLGFWVFAIVYTLRFLFPAIRVELFQIQ